MVVGMNPQDAALLQQLAEANYHREGLKIADFGALSHDDFATLNDAAHDIIGGHKPSIIEAGHVTNWTKPQGTVHQWSCWNTHGNTSNTVEDFNYNPRGRTFVHSGLEEFFSKVPGLANLRLNMMMPESGLSPHEEHIVLPGGKMRIRYHIPIQTNRYCTSLLERDWYHMKKGHLYLFNNGCVHAARNGSRTYSRFHFVFDQMLTEEACDTLCGRLARASVPKPDMTEEKDVQFVPSPGVTEAEFSGGRYW